MAQAVPSLYEMVVGSWSSILRTAIVGVLAYVGLVAVLRASGKRTLSKLNAFDLVVTVALGSCLATILLSNSASLLQGLTAFGVLVSLQYLVAWASTRSRRIASFVKSSPALVYYGGAFMDEALERERLTREEIYAAVRDSGIARLEQVAAVVLESDGSLSVIAGHTRKLDTLGDVCFPNASGECDSQQVPVRDETAPARAGVRDKA